MTDKIRLIYNKIENRIDEICDDGFVSKENQQEYETLTDLEDFIDSLPEEPASDDLEEEIKRYINEEVIVTNENVVISKHHEFHNFYVENLVDVARHFAEWQKNKMKEALQTEYEKGRSDKQQEMMKDAVDVIFIQDYAYKTPVLYGDLKYKMNIVSGQPIKLYQIKKEQQ